jgi:hypothetical protein
MEFSPTSLFAGFAFGVFGFYFLKEGRRKGNPVPILIGLTLMIFPYFVESALLTWGIGVALMGAGFKVKSRQNW